MQRGSTRRRLRCWLRSWLPGGLDEQHPVLWCSWSSLQAHLYPECVLCGMDGADLPDSDMQWLRGSFVAQLVAFWLLLLKVLIFSVPCVLE
jgi:hypothetical protein